MTLEQQQGELAINASGSWETLGSAWSGMGAGLGRTLTEAGAGWIHQQSSKVPSGP